MEEFRPDKKEIDAIEKRIKELENHSLDRQPEVEVSKFSILTKKDFTKCRANSKKICEDVLGNKKLCNKEKLWKKYKMGKGNSKKCW